MESPADKELQKRLIFAWLDDLRTPGRKQGRGRLSTDDGDCCMGRACYVAIDCGVAVNAERDFVDGYTGFDGADFLLPESVQSVLGLQEDNGRYGTDTTDTLVTLNDHGDTFPQIADAIEKYARTLFVNGDEVAQWIEERKAAAQ